MVPGIRIEVATIRIAGVITTDRGIGIASLATCPLSPPVVKWLLRHFDAAHGALWSPFKPTPAVPPHFISSCHLTTSAFAKISFMKAATIRPS
jgi:hypothetical protein